MIRSHRYRIIIALTLFAPVLSHAQAGAAPWLDPAAFGARTDKSDAARTTRAWKECIEQAAKSGARIRFTGDHLVNTDELVLRSPVIIEGNGVRVSRLYTTGPGALMKLDAALPSSTGKGVQLRDFGLFNESAATAPGSIGIELTNSTRANNAFSWLANLVVSGFHDDIRVHNQYFYSITDCYLDNYRRYGIRVSNDWTYDSGDGIIRGNWIQPIQTVDGTGYDRAGSNIRVEQNPGIRIVGNKIFPGHPAGIHIYANGVLAADAIPSGMYMIMGNQFDSFGAERDAIVIDGDWGRGGAGGSLVGNRLMNIQITGNNLSNCSRLVDIRSRDGAMQGVSIVGNSAYGGGGIRVSGAVDGLFIDGNYFDNRAHGGGAGSGYGPRKPIEVSGTAVNWRAGTNGFNGFYDVADMPDVGAAPVTSVSSAPSTSTAATSSTAPRTDGSPGIAGVAVSDGVATIVPVSRNGRESHLIVVNGDLAITFDGVGDGDEGTIMLMQSGPGHTVRFTPPAGLDLQYEEGRPIELGRLDDHVDVVSWLVRGPYLIIRRALPLGVIRGSTAE